MIQTLVQIASPVPCHPQGWTAVRQMRIIQHGGAAHHSAWLAGTMTIAVMAKAKPKQSVAAIALRASILTPMRTQANVHTHTQMDTWVHACLQALTTFAQIVSESRMWAVVGQARLHHRRHTRQRHHLRHRLRRHRLRHRLRRLLRRDQQYPATRGVSQTRELGTRNASSTSALFAINARIKGLIAQGGVNTTLGHGRRSANG